MKTEPMAHQVEGLSRLRAAPTCYALGAEQGTGKTWMILADAEERFAAGEITALFVIAPNGVHTNWVLREVPRHLSVAHRAVWWSSGAGVKHSRLMESVAFNSDPDQLVIFTMNVDAVNTKKGYEFAHRFLTKHRAIMVVDESQRIKNPRARRTKRTHELGQLAAHRRIASGTLVSNSPLDLFGQYEFLRPGLLGTKSYHAFVAEYAQVLPASHPMVRNISAKTRGTPQIVARDEEGNPIYRNTDKLAHLMAPHTYRVTKDQCLDLPPKVYQSRYFELSPAQSKVYAQVAEEMRWERDNGEIDIFTAMTLINKLRQVTSGFILVDGHPSELARSEERIRALRDALEDTELPVVIWASFREELSQLERAMTDAGHSVVTYHGGTSNKARQEAVDAFQNGSADVFLGHPAAAGTGLTLTKARTVIYYSCSFSLEERVQSEDRAHRIGTHRPVVYVDLVASGTVDERIAESLQRKATVAEEIMASI